MKTIFSGRIIEVNHTLEPGIFQVVAVDRRVNLQNNQLTNFGLAKNNNIARVVRRGARGQHIFADSVIPISTESVTRTTHNDGMTTESMNLKQTLRDEGNLNVLNFKVDEDGTGIETEAITGDNAIINTNYKAPFRGITVERAINEILDRYDINPQGIDIPTVNTDAAVWNSRGRPAYEIESAEASCNNNYEFQWRGQITDYLHNLAHRNSSSSTLIGMRMSSRLSSVTILAMENGRSYTKQADMKSGGKLQLRTTRIFTFSVAHPNMIEVFLNSEHIIHHWQPIQVTSGRVV